MKPKNVVILNPNRISDHCVSSEDLRIDSNATHIVFVEQQGFSIWLMKKHDLGTSCFGYIDFEDCKYLGDDIIITKFVIHDDPELATILTNKYKGKIVIFSQADNLQ